MSKGWIIGCGIGGVLSIGLCAGLIAFFVFGLFAFTQPVVTAADEFLSLLGQGKTAEAYAATASGFRSQQDEAAFTAAAQRVGLTDFAAVTWHKRNRVNQQADVEGTVTTKSGIPRPVALRLAEEGGQWKVSAVRYRGIDLAEIPSEADLGRMATTALLIFNQAVQTRDFAAFHFGISALWKKQTTPQQLQTAFQEFIDKGIDIAPIKDVAVQLDPPTASEEEGVLLVKGHYPTKPSQVRFTLKYVRDGAEWKLFGVHVKVGE